MTNATDGFEAATGDVKLGATMLAVSATLVTAGGDAALTSAATPSAAASFDIDNGGSTSADDDDGAIATIAPCTENDTDVGANGVGLDVETEIGGVDNTTDAGAPADAGGVKGRNSLSVAEGACEITGRGFMFDKSGIDFPIAKVEASVDDDKSAILGDFIVESAAPEKDPSLDMNAEGCFMVFSCSAP